MGPDTERKSKYKPNSGKMGLTPRPAGPAMDFFSGV